MDIFCGFELQSKIFLEKEELKHCFKVLRKKSGDHISVIDGKGNYWLCEIIENTLASGEVKLLDSLSKSEKSRKSQITLAVAPTKSMDRIEWLLEKAIETGIDRLVLIKTKRTERSKVNLQRLEKIAWAALKQSGQLFFPQLLEMTFKDFLDNPFSEQKFIAYCPDREEKLKLNAVSIKQDVTFAIGPEGDFTPEEYDAAKSKGFKPLSLGEQRFRTETAALLCVMTCHVLQEN
jgi:16S rRNA (uracil1498-N3)-methyltransferase